MWFKVIFLVLSALVLQTVYVAAVSDTQETQSYEDARCKCTCPNLQAKNETRTSRDLYLPITVTVPPSKCNCMGAFIPNVDPKKLGDIKPADFCARCECVYENRNTTIIKVVVIIVIWVISLLVVYMLFLICLDPLLNKRVQNSYTEHTNEDEVGGGEGSSHPMGVRSNVLNRVGHQQDKWKRQVREQRRNIYDRHTMLN